MTTSVLGIVWYEESEYDRCKASFIDGDALEDSWAQWKKRADEIRNELVKDGFVVIQVRINPDTFPAWCVSQGVQPDHNARTAFATVEACRAAAEQHIGPLA